MQAQPAERPPNIIVILADDLGYNDLGAYGSRVHRTPHLDRMAAEGVRFTDFYVTSGVCTPSRASLMTGAYPRRVTMHENERGAWVLFPVDARGLHPDEVTIAEVLTTQGYATGMVGKWHLGDQPAFLPTRQGFDTYFGLPYSNDMGHDRSADWPPLPLLDGEAVVETDPDQRLITQRYTEAALRFIHAHRDEPFFLYLAHTMPHIPAHASDDYRGRSINGRYGDAVEELDGSTGQVLALLGELGIDDRTLVVFTSDNGAEAQWGGSNYPLRGWKGTTMEGGMRVPMIARWPGQIPAGMVVSEMATSMDLMPTFAHLAGTAPPQDRVIDGRDIRPLLMGAAGATSPHEALFYYYRGELQAVRSGPWKLHLFRNERQQTFLRSLFGDGDVEVPVRLYDLSRDISENTDVAAEHPAVVARLRALAEAAMADLGDGDRAGARQRPAGHVDTPVPLVRPR